ncbi:MAG: hypothetical protein D4R44_01920 [Actinobacteria bacterium]|nr:MAG: hypothetical protein D4R44_01920 [Actinomycetota bacterium]
MVGVLAAGVTAFAVNTSVLNHATKSSEASPALQADVVAFGITDQTPSTLAPAPGTAAPTAVESKYNIDGVGVVTLAQDAAVLTTVAVEPLNGFTFETKNVNDSRVEVRLTKDAKQLVFHAELLDGRIVTSLTSPRTPHVAPQAAPETISVGTPAGAKGSGDDGDEDGDD